MKKTVEQVWVGGAQGGRRRTKTIITKPNQLDVNRLIAMRSLISGTMHCLNKKSSGGVS